LTVDFDASIKYRFSIDKSISIVNDDYPVELIFELILKIFLQCIRAMQVAWVREIKFEIKSSMIRDIIKPRVFPYCVRIVPMRKKN